MIKLNRFIVITSLIGLNACGISPNLEYNPTSVSASPPAQPATNTKPSNITTDSSIPIIPKDLCNVSILGTKWVKESVTSMYPGVEGARSTMVIDQLNTITESPSFTIQETPFDGASVRNFNYIWERGVPLEGNDGPEFYRLQFNRISGKDLFIVVDFFVIEERGCIKLGLNFRSPLNLSFIYSTEIMTPVDVK